MKPINKIQFPSYQGIVCNMMPFIQGDSDSLPDEYKSYSSIIDNNYLELGEIGHLTIQESVVEIGKSQRGYNSHNIGRNVHVEVGQCKAGNKWGNSWGGTHNVLLEDEVEILIANNINDTCKVWDTLDHTFTSDGDLSSVIHNYPENTGILMKAGEVYKISIFTPHECINQQQSGKRQFFRVVGKGVTGREPYFTINPKLSL